MVKELDMEAQYAHIKKGGVHLYVKHNGEMLGKLSVTNATVAWFPKNAKKPVVKMAWEKFDRVMQKMATPGETI